MQNKKWKKKKEKKSLSSFYHIAKKKKIIFYIISKGWRQKAHNHTEVNKIYTKFQLNV